jgi:hypothetical protein
MKLKKIIPLKSVLLFSVSSLLIVSCGNHSDEAETESHPENAKAATIKINNAIFSVPSPIQTALLIKKSGVAFKPAFLNSPDKAEHYATAYAKALNVGVYGADLGYVAIYDQKQEAFKFMKATKALAEELNISDAFNNDLMDRFNRNMNNKDSLLSLISVAYRTTSAYLKNNDQNDICGLIVAGGWIESLHLATEVYNLSANEEVKVRIAEQKTSLKSVIAILSPYADRPEYTGLITSLKNLETLYYDVSFNNTLVQATTDATKRLTVINCKTEVIISPEQIKSISKEVAAIRKQIIE